MDQLTGEQKAVLRGLTERLQFNENGLYHASSVPREVDELLTEAQELGLVHVEVGTAPAGVHGEMAEHFANNGRAVQLNEPATTWLREQSERREGEIDRR